MWNIVIWTSTVRRTFAVGEVDLPTLYAALAELSCVSGEAPIMFGDRVDEPITSLGDQSSDGFPRVGEDSKWRSI
jgi:hypothetical protein